MTTIHQIQRRIKDHHACDKGMAWLKKQSSIEQAWKSCKRGDWMIWLLGYAARNIRDQDEKFGDLCDDMYDVAYMLDGIYGIKHLARVAEVYADDVLAASSATYSRSSCCSQACKYARTQRFPSAVLTFLPGEHEEHRCQRQRFRSSTRSSPILHAMKD